MPLQTDCGSVELEPIRARVVINDALTIETPYVKSFSVNKSRTSNVGTFSISIEVPSNVSFGTPTGSGGKVQIFAGSKDNYISKGPIFTGKIRTLRPNPTPGKPNYFTISLSGDDALANLQNKKFSRRIPTDGPGLFVTITGAASSRPSSMTWSVDGRAGKAGGGSFTSSKPGLTDRKQHNSLTHHRDYNKGTSDWVNKGGVTPVPEPGSGSGGSGLNVHDHSTMSLGGPAFGVYSPS